jgi:hypothetical protein
LNADDIPVYETETTFEINFAVMKFRQNIKKTEKKPPVQEAKKTNGAGRVAKKRQ